jgi:hypothetical protein
MGAAAYSKGETVMAIAEKELVIKTGKAAAAKPSRYGVTALTAAELGGTQEGTKLGVPQEIQDAANTWIEGYKSTLIARGEQYLQRLEAQRANGAVGLGEPTVNDYVAFDIVSVSPIQFLGLPPYAPSKIVASGELMLLLAVQWINPAVDVANGFAIPATVQLANRMLRVAFDQLNLTTASAGPNFVHHIALPAPAPAFLIIPQFVLAPAVASPQLIEINVTSDIENPVQPYAAFATWHYDTDADLPWFMGFPPAVAPGLRHDVPMRYLVYPK